MLNRVMVKIGTIERLKEFSKIVTSFDSDINIYYDEVNYYDAKSILAVMALDVLKPRMLEIISDDQNEIATFLNKMERFIAWLLYFAAHRVLESLP